MTQPSSLETEELINQFDNLPIAEDSPYSPKGKITIVEGIESPYRLTALGRLEAILNQREALRVL